MHTRNQNRSSANGFSLIEAILVLFLGIFAVVGGLNLYGVGDRHIEVERATIQVTTFAKNLQSVFANSVPGAQPISLQDSTLISQNLAAPGTANQARDKLINPWGGDIEIFYADGAPGYWIVYADLPTAACARVATSVARRLTTNQGRLLDARVGGNSLINNPSSNGSSILNSQGAVKSVVAADGCVESDEAAAAWHVR